ncbi:MAG: glycosyltransferase family 2 protein [Patescibacteria group bacterium]
MVGPIVSKLAIVILNYNTKDLVKGCLDSLLPLINETVDLIVVDNASTDDSLEYLRTVERIELLTSKENLGFTGGNNLGLRRALEKKADYIMLLNSDTLAKNAFWQPMIEFLKNNPKVGVVGPKIYFAPGYEFYKDKYKKEDLGKVIWSVGGSIDWNNVYGENQGVDQVDEGQFDQPAEADFISGCCLLASREVWQKIGLLNEKYFLYYEDTEFSLRVKKTGRQVWCFPGSVIWHLNAGSSQCGGDLQDYFITRNRLLFGLSWAPIRTKLALIRESFRLLASGRSWQKKGVRDFYLRKFNRGSWQ